MASAIHGLNGQHQDINRTLRGRVNQNDRGHRQMKKVRPWCGQPSDRGRLKNTTEHREANRHQSTLCDVMTINNSRALADKPVLICRWLTMNDCPRSTVHVAPFSSSVRAHVDKESSTARLDGLLGPCSELCEVVLNWATF